MSPRAYLDWNAAAPLRPEAREAVLAATDAVGNPSSVHAEGRAARAIVERARAQVAALVGCDPHDLVFTSGATEAAALVLGAAWTRVLLTPVEHDCIDAPVRRAGRGEYLPLDADGVLHPRGLSAPADGDLVCVQAASGETGIVQDVHGAVTAATAAGVPVLVDGAQAAGKLPVRLDEGPRPDFFMLSASKLGGPRGVGALVLGNGRDVPAPVSGGGQELGRRSGTENVAGIAGFGAAAEAAVRDLDRGVWSRVEELRNILEERLERIAPDTIFVGRKAPRLPNTSCFAVPGWKAETQVMQSDLAGFAVSAGSACSSGKVGRSRVLEALGLGDEVAASAIRVSIGPGTTEAEILAFAEAWTTNYRRRPARAA